MKLACGVALLGSVLLCGCQADMEEQQEPAAQGNPRLRIPVVVAPYGGVASVDPTATANPTPTPGATPTPGPGSTPTPTPEPTPTPTPPNLPAGCEGLGLTIGAHCAGSTPRCGIQDPKNPRVEAREQSKVVLDSSYYLGSPSNKIHVGDQCYPGAVSGWTIPGGVRCGEPFSNNHVITCGPFATRGSYSFQACGAGLCGSITVEVW